MNPLTSPSVSLKSELLAELPFDNAANEQSTRIDTSYKLKWRQTVVNPGEVDTD